MVLIKFSIQVDVDSFYMVCNGCQFNLIEDDVCQLVYVERVEVFKFEDGVSFLVMDLIEFFKCMVCLECMDEFVNGIFIMLCNYSFYSQCLQCWDDIMCFVCWYC